MIIQLGESITYLCKTIEQLTVVIKCKEANTYLKHQKLLKSNSKNSLKRPKCLIYLIYNQNFILWNKG